MIDCNRNGSPAHIAPDQAQSAEHSHREDIQRLLVEHWKRQIVKQKLIEARHRGLISRAASTNPAALDEISIVSRIGCLWKRRAAK
jgi:hypothetical protein